MGGATEPEIDQSDGSVGFRDGEGGGPIGALLLAGGVDGVGQGMDGDTADDIIRAVE